MENRWNGDIDDTFKNISIVTMFLRHSFVYILEKVLYYFSLFFMIFATIKRNLLSQEAFYI